MRAAKLQVQDSGGSRWASALQRHHGDLLDINVWFALVVENHAHHSIAKAYWEDVCEMLANEQASGSQAPERKLHFCRHSMLGMIRLLTQPKTMQGSPLAVHEAWSIYQRFRLLPEVAFIGEEASGLNMDRAIDQLLESQGQLPARFWMDTYLASLSQSSGLRFVTLDHDFKRFDLPTMLLLEPN
jgi:uncharacterized protein